MPYDALASELSLTGSLLSCVGSGCILICFVVYRKSQRSFRHALVFNLAVSDFINSLTNSISGLIYVSEHELRPGPACTFNGWATQVSVQATDFSILAIGIATLLVVTRQAHLDNIPNTKRLLYCLALWIMPLISSTTVAGLGEMKPVSGNWCWISKGRPDLRYGLAHGWRFVIILITICIYVYIYQYLSRHFKSLVAPAILFTKNANGEQHLHIRRWEGPSRGYQHQSSSDSELHLTDHHPTPEVPMPPLQAPTRPHQQEQVHIQTTFNVDVTSGASSSETPSGMQSKVSAGEPGRHLPHRAAGSSRRSIETEIKRMLLLNGYPIMYIILWIPGLTNRGLEASGRPSSSKVLAALQCSTQFVGFANALTYGLNREMRKILGRDLRRWMVRGGKS